jgi:adenine-specific DNA glycosylase
MQFGSRNHASTNSRCSRLIFLAFSAAFHCFDLAEANEEVLKLWQGLGYYSRAGIFKTATAWELGVFQIITVIY